MSDTKKWVEVLCKAFPEKEIELAAREILHTARFNSSKLSSTIKEKIRNIDEDKIRKIKKEYEKRIDANE